MNVNVEVDLTKLSGCAVATAINEIGPRQLHLYANHQDLLNEFSDEELLDYLVNSKRDLSKYIFDCFMAEVQLDGHNAEHLRTRIVNALKELYT